MYIDINRYIELKEWEDLKFQILNLKSSEMGKFTSKELSIFSFDIWNLLKEWLRLSDSLEEIIPKLEDLLTQSLDLSMHQIPEEDYCWLFGYMLQVGPENFNLEYFRAEEKGVMLLNKAIQKFNNPVAKIFLKNSLSNAEEILTSKKYIQSLFGITSSIYLYFNDILDCNLS